MDCDAFRCDSKTIRAVERALQIISEAAIRLGAAAELLCPGLPWHNIRGIGNWLRHQYDRVDVDTVWNTVRDDLPPLEKAVEAVLERLGIVQINRKSQRRKNRRILRTPELRRTKDADEIHRDL
jgi:uncharacterized protein with HEPN domain